MKGHVNSSGFPLQIGIGNLVNNSADRHGWNTLYTEHSWNHPETGDSGFIDLVLINHARTTFFSVECKRVQDTSWIFLNESKDVKFRRHAKAFVFSKEDGNIKRFEWNDLTLSPDSPEAQFCVIPGSDAKSMSLIERAAAELVSSTEALAIEDKSFTLGEKNFGSSEKLVGKTE